MATIEIRDVWKKFPLQAAAPRSLKAALVQFARRSGQTQPAEPFWALRDVSFDIERGETFGIIGRNGSGKSTLLKLISGISRPTKGVVGINGRVSALLELGAGFHPDFSGRENTFLNGAILGLSQSEVRAKFDSIVSFAELEAFIDNPVKTYSSGMYMRLAFSIAIHVDPDILLVDEVLAVGDAAFQQKCYDQIHRFKHQGKTIVFVSHSLNVVQELCQRAAWLDGGVLRALGKTDAVLDFYGEQISAAVEKNKHEVELLVPSDRATIRNVRSHDGNGVPCGVLSAEEPAHFSFDLDSRLDCSELDIVARIYRTDGICCYDVTMPMTRIANGTAAGSVALKIPELRLHTGTYSMHLYAVSTPDESVLDEKFFNFAVESTHRGHGVGRLECEWMRTSEVPAR